MKVENFSLIDVMAARAWKQSYEPKVADFPPTANLFGTTGQLPATGAFGRYSLCQIAQGSGLANRQGREIIVTSLAVNGILSLVPSAGVTNGGGVFRIYCVEDQQNNYTNYTTAWPVGPGTDMVTELLTSGDVVSFTNPANKQRFRVLGQTVVTMNPRSDSLPSAFCRPYSKAFTLELNFPTPINVVYNGSTGNSTEIASSNILLVCVPNCSAAVLATVNLAVGVRTVFTG